MRKESSFQEEKQSQEIKREVVGGFVCDPHFTKSLKYHDFFKGTAMELSVQTLEEGKGADVFWALLGVTHGVECTASTISFNPLWPYGTIITAFL